MKISKKNVKTIITILLIILLMALIGICFYVNKETLINRISSKNGTFKQQENNSGVNNIDISEWDLEKVNIVYDTEGVPVPVPKGFAASQVNGEHTVNTGFVIYEGENPVTGLPGEVVGTYSSNSDSAWVASCTRNQFVWVPVPDSSRIYESDSLTGKAKAKLWRFTEDGRSQISNIYNEPGALSHDNEKRLSENGMQGMTKEMLLEELETEFEETIKSIEKYGGFYIGRYEIGGTTPEEALIRRMVTPISGERWYLMYPIIRNINSDENMQTNMMWGCLWDETLQWLIDTGDKIQTEISTDSSSWGDYLDTSFEYMTKTGETLVKEPNRHNKLETGSAERNKANNIYDMAGNVGELTLEGDVITNRVVRGGYYDFSATKYPVHYRDAISPWVDAYNIIGFRAYLYIR